MTFETIFTSGLVFRVYGKIRLKAIFEIALGFYKGLKFRLLVTFAITTGQYKTRFAKFVAINHTKACTFAIEKIAKEPAFFPSHLDTFQQFERF